MQTVKRILWVEDNEKALNDSIRNLFDDTEKKSIDSMHQAIDEISSIRLYNYDTIVLDIDFRDDSRSNFPYVIKKLKERIYLKKDQCKKNENGEYSYIIENGGYLLFLYLMERGYPSDRIAFLTGNQDIINKLKMYTMTNKEDLSREEIADLFREKWTESDGDFEEFEQFISDLDIIDEEYKFSELVDKYEGALIEEDYDRLLDIVKSVDVATYNDTPSEYENDMIFRFHKANLESPKYFTKHEDEIAEHNLEDARKWIDGNRTTDKVLRWLALVANKYVDDLWKNNSQEMTHQIRNLLYLDEDDDPTYDFGVRNAFRQMAFVYDGLKAIDNYDLPGVNYQAASVLLIPYEAKILNDSSNDCDLLMRRNLAYGSKKARNYCAHNYLGSAISDRNTLFLIMLVLSSVLDFDQREREYIKTWYWKAAKEIKGNETIPEYVDDTRIDDLIQALWNSDPCMISNQCEQVAHINSEKPLCEYTPRNFVDVMGWHSSMKKKKSKRENYYVFTLASYVLKVFSGLSAEEILEKYGFGIKTLYDISKLKVDSYNFNDPF